MNRPIVIALCVFIIFALAYLLILPKYQTLESARSNIEKKQGELNYLKDYFAELEEISKDFKGYETEFLKIESALPLGPSLPSLLHFIQTKASQNGLVLKNVSMTTMSSFAQSSNIKEYHFTIELSGFYPAFKNFLSTLEKSGRLIEIERISFVAPEEKEPTSFGIGIKVYSEEYWNIPK